MLAYMLNDNDSKTRSFTTNKASAKELVSCYVLPDLKALKLPLPAEVNLYNRHRGQLLCQWNATADHSIAQVQEKLNLVVKEGSHRLLRIRELAVLPWVHTSSLSAASRGDVQAAEPSKTESSKRLRSPYPDGETEAQAKRFCRGGRTDDNALTQVWPEPQQSPVPGPVEVSASHLATASEGSKLANDDSWQILPGSASLSDTGTNNSSHTSTSGANAIRDGTTIPAGTEAQAQAHSSSTQVAGDTTATSLTSGSCGVSSGLATNSTASSVASGSGNTHLLPRHTTSMQYWVFHVNTSPATTSHRWLRGGTTG
ncbi:uncharacterized protein B0H18DRAFT_952960 [Fomitopsis serialis]|uniref:uncharacterized protein n=1 Tax=Fomitopsis serialis TaxID=139415 RepID=UPI0020074DC1|nr:uncharacterized protein B0H18DRAFT_952960 [Neoantrodia serialis]KAH9930956.1 hypothetical protein B0H18DRAFT_952960 [Neoantrodia serialis]